MGKQADKHPCPECGGGMRYEERDDILEYRARTRTIRTLGWWCTKCGEGIVTGEPLMASERALRELKAEVDGALGPSDVVRIREQ